MDTQEAFNIMVTHLRNQGVRATDYWGCVYFREEDGAKCAVGCLIPEGVYSPTMEGNGSILSLLTAKEHWDNLANEWAGNFMFPKLVKHLEGVNRQMMFNMQTIHDSKDVTEWETGFAQVAETYKLTVPPMPEDSHE
jgi:hypothetical protein